MRIGVRNLAEAESAARMMSAACNSPPGTLAASLSEERRVERNVRDARWERVFSQVRFGDAVRFFCFFNVFDRKTA